jgi:NAD(P)-dependent dehydrogenase (short-subunit alcohol dehydrogenase family)
VARRVVLVTGAGSGLGRAAAGHLAGRGHTVYGGDLAEVTAPGVRGIHLDVRDEGSAARAVRTVLDAEGRLDVLVNNAGNGVAGAVEETSLEEARGQLEVNFFGVLVMARAVLPVLRGQRSGTVVNVSSLGGLVGLPFQGLYSASKFAVEGLSEALRAEVAPFGVHVVLVEPADFATGFTAARRLTAAAGREESPYRAAFAATLRVIEADEGHGSEPALVGPLLERIVEARRPRLRYTVGAPSERLAAGLKRLLPARVFWPIVDRHYQVAGDGR